MAVGQIFLAAAKEINARVGDQVLISMTEFTLREAAREDMPSLIRLCKETIYEVYGPILSAEALVPWVEGNAAEALIEEQWPRMIVAEMGGGGEVMGVAAASEDAVDLLWVHPSHHREGIGTALLGRVEAELQKKGHRTIKLSCFSQNLRAMSFYLKRGWTVASEGRNEEAEAPETRMVKSLIEEDRHGDTMKMRLC